MSLQLLERNFKFEIPPIELKEAPLALPPVQVPLREVSPRVQRRLSKRARAFAAVEVLEGRAGLAKPTVEDLARLFREGSRDRSLVSAEVHETPPAIAEPDHRLGPSGR